MKPLLLHRVARAELEDALAYYGRLEPSRDVEFMTAVSRALARVQSNPNHLPLHHRAPYRKCSVPGFPFNIFFRELPEFIWIPVIMHHAREPDYWIEREVED